jgi:hypothetical protein
MAFKPNFKGDPENFRIFREDVGSGFVRDILPSDASMLAPYLGSHPETVHIAGSGIPPTQAFDFKAGEPQVALEWVRREPNPKTALNEPDINVNRFVFGLTTDGKSFHGYDVTEEKPGVSKEQVGDHWMDFYDAAVRYPPDTKD